MRRLALLAVGGAVWLFLAAIPVFADGGPHVASINSGAGGLTADSCAGCHRAHTAQGELLLNAPSEEALCLTCHGTTGTGATTNVEDGVQYTLATSGQVRGATVLGALRGGGFVNARIASGSGARLAYTSGTAVRNVPKVPVAAAGQAVTSAHLDIANPGATGTVWGNGPISATANAGGTGVLSCGSCHNPHGNGQYRILNPIPEISEPNGFVAATTGVNVTDAPAPAAGDTRNYTVIQTRDNTNTMFVSQIVSAGYTATQGDYFRRRVPWNATTAGTYSPDSPNGVSAGTGAWTLQMAQWCSQCHTRYYAGSGSYETDSGDAIYKYRHPTDGTTRNCITCHVAHGSNAQMTGVYAANQTYPGGAAAPVGDSRLLKLDNRGTCQACHDPTGTITAGTLVGPTPSPLVP